MTDEKKAAFDPSFIEHLPSATCAVDANGKLTLWNAAMAALTGQPASAVPVEAAHLAVQFLGERAGVERLTAYFYAENRYAAKVAEKFGFRPEGVLRGYILDADGRRSDLLVSGLLVAETQKAARRRLFRG